MIRVEQHAKALVNSQTGFIHFCSSALPEEIHYSIPLYENFLFSLALLQEKTQETIGEAKTLLTKLLPFQTGEGNFPLHLHEYPICHDRYFAIHLLPCFYRILSPFKSVIGSELSHKLTQAKEKLVAYSLKQAEECTLPDTFLIKLGASLHAFGYKEGLLFLEKAPKTADCSYWYQPSLIGDVLSSLQLIYPSLENSPWRNFWEHVNKTWHKKACAFIGPSLKEFQNYDEPKPSLYDLQMGSYFGNFSKRALKFQPYHLQYALVNSREDCIGSSAFPSTYSGTFQGNPWVVVQQQNYGLSAMASIAPRNRSNEQGFHLLRLVWGSHAFTHSLVAQGGNWKAFSFELAKDGIDCFFDLDLPCEEEEREKQREICFFANLSPDSILTVDGKSSTIFLPGQKIELRQKEFCASLVFQLVDSSGNFQGHLMRGNRPSQVGDKGIHKFSSYDFQIFLRTISRLHPCRIKVSLRVHAGCSESL